MLAFVALTITGAVHASDMPPPSALSISGTGVSVNGKAGGSVGTTIAVTVCVAGVRLSVIDETESATGPAGNAMTPGAETSLTNPAAVNDAVPNAVSVPFQEPNTLSLLLRLGV